MPVYHYKCEECEFDKEIHHSIHQDILKKCPDCSSDTFHVVIDTIPHGSVKEIKTLGQLAEYNAKKMGSEQLQKKMESDGTLDAIKRNKEMEKISKLTKLSPEKKEKYIMTGKI